MSALSEGIYLLKNEASGLYAGVRGARTEQSTPVVQQEPHPRGTARHSQLWHLRPDAAEAGAWTLQSVHSTMRMDIMTGRDRTDSPVLQCPAETRQDLLASQLWRPEATGDGRYTLVNVNSGHLLSVHGDSSAPDAALEQAGHPTMGARPAQEWHLERVPSRGEVKAFDALTATVVSAGGGILGSVLGSLSGAAKQALDAGGGIFESAAKAIPDSDTPYVRFDGFRGDEFIRFSKRRGIEAGPRKLSDQFPHLPKPFSDGFDAVGPAARGSGHTFLGFTGGQALEFSDKGHGPVHDAEHLLHPALVQQVGELCDVTGFGADGGRLLVFGRGDNCTVDPAGVDLARGSHHQRFTLTAAPDAFGFGPDAATTAVTDSTAHYFLTKGEEFVVVSEDKLIQGPARLTEAYPFLDGLWM
ncbi:RICIN domain-containing protein [Streptomyces rectiviolaceus]|uniref:Ricin B lectin domain-containing protein n=1 Tax=Streptomyces rectiviolaceus TaxID=332591 RepID=A0ABP6MEW8_9ACTN